MILEDFILLGTTVPEPQSDGRTFVCSAGYSAELRKLIRIYPLARRGIPHRWHRYRIPVERNAKDCREESFKIKGDRSEGAHDKINDLFNETDTVKPGQLRQVLIKDHLVESVQEANERRLSLAIIQPTFHGISYDFNQDSPDSPQLALFDYIKPVPEGSKRFPFNPRIAFTDAGGDHSLQLRDWGCYEYMRKYPDQARDLNVHLSQRSTLLIGNMNNHRNSWLAISVLNGLRNDQQGSLFEEAA